ncbi:FMN reductase [Oikeobacillus pervagus]|uniref:FMN reductase n=1 Tax=Oikeobacillus pervagus TaxID=1325931 RepID=A0AAJ1T5C8_9BACI|nr:NADPH-dependent FMN reductase [Oikeobacillus pervagus]MDQ0215120.1 FMN reductase [Oikeobacillus pervagus]
MTEKIVIIVGSPLRPSRSDAVADYLQKDLQAKGKEVTQISVAELPGEDVFFANFKSPEINKKIDIVKEADAVVFVSPVYKASIPGALKAFIDLMPMDILRGKRVFPIMVGGTIAHLLTIEMVLNPLLSVIGATHIAKGVYIIDQMIEIGENGDVSIDPEIQSRLNTSLVELIE